MHFWAKQPHWLRGLSGEGSISEPSAANTPSSWGWLQLTGEAVSAGHQHLLVPKTLKIQTTNHVLHGCLAWPLPSSPNSPHTSSLLLIPPQLHTLPASLFLKHSILAPTPEKLLSPFPQTSAGWILLMVPNSDQQSPPQRHPADALPGASSSISHSLPQCPFL